MSTAPHRPRRRARLRQWLSQAAPYGGALLLLAGLVRSGISESLDLLLYDSITSLRPTPSARALPITIVGIGEGDIAHYGWPIDDGVLCRAIERTSAGGARSGARERPGRQHRCPAAAAGGDGQRQHRLAPPAGHPRQPPQPRTLAEPRLRRLRQP
ncbi:MAG: CHASE2 domain-containing protein [Vulcanococcus sp.]